MLSEIGRTVVNMDGQRRRATYSIITDEISLGEKTAVESYGIRISVGAERACYLRHLTFSRRAVEAVCRELIRSHVGPDEFEDRARQAIQNPIRESA